MHENSYDGQLLVSNIAGRDWEYFAITREHIAGHEMFEATTKLYRVYRQRRYSGEIFGSPVARIYNDYGRALQAAMGNYQSIY